jgi:hypothetical protein
MMMMMMRFSLTEGGKELSLFIKWLLKCNVDSHMQASKMINLEDFGYCLVKRIVLLLLWLGE